MSRLDQLVALRRQIDAEIEREHAAIIRQQNLRRTALVAITRGSWNTRVFAAVCDHYDVDGDAVLGGSRSRAATDARHVAMWLMRDADRTLTEIGDEMDRDHTTVLNAVRRVDRTSDLLTVATEIRALLTGEPTAPSGAVA